VPSGPVVVIVLSHRDPPLVRRLVARLTEGTDTVVVLHHDPRGPELDLPASARVLRVPDAQPSNWGGMGLARTMLSTIAYAAKQVPELSWVLLTSGQDYPCRPMQDIEAELTGSPHDAFLRYFPVDADPVGDVHRWQGVTRRRYLHRRRLPGSHRSVPLPRRHPFVDGTRLFVGDMWVNLGASAVAHVIEQRLRLARVERYLSTCSVPDEAFLPTLLLNDSDHLDIVNDRRRYIRWTEGQPHPEFLTTGDVAAAVAGTDFFARKVDSATTAEALDLLDERGGDRSQTEG